MLPRRAPPSWFERKILQSVLARVGSAPIDLVLWNGERYSAAGLRPAAEVFIRDRRTLLKLAINPDLYFGDGYSDDAIRVEGDLVALLQAIYVAKGDYFPERAWAKLMSRWQDWVSRNTRHGSRRNIHHHYDIRTDF